MREELGLGVGSCAFGAGLDSLLQVSSQQITPELFISSFVLWGALWLSAEQLLDHYRLQVRKLRNMGGAGRGIRSPGRALQIPDTLHVLRPLLLFAAMCYEL